MTSMMEAAEALRAAVIVFESEITEAMSNAGIEKPMIKISNDGKVKLLPRTFNPTDLSEIDAMCKAWLTARGQIKPKVV